MGVSHREELSSLVVAVALGDGELAVQLQHVLLVVHYLLGVGALAATDLGAARLGLLSQHVLHLKEVIVVSTLFDESSTTSGCVNRRNVATSLQSSYLCTR